MGGNGDYIPHSGRVIAPLAGFNGTSIQLPAGNGGGNVTTGAFANLTVNLGPVDGVEGTAPGPDGGLGFNPRTMTRDLGGVMNMQYANYTIVLSTCLAAFATYLSTNRLYRSSYLSGPLVVSLPL